MTKFFIFSVVIISLFSCENKNTPNLSEERIKKLMNDSTVFPRSNSNDIPTGIRYTEIRTIDPFTPPEILDIAGNLENRRIFKLSDIASSVRYVILRQPPDKKYSSIFGFSSDDKHIFINTMQGLFCYSAEGLYLYNMKNQREFPVEEGGLKMFVAQASYGNIDLFNGKLAHRVLGNQGYDDYLSIFDVKELDAQMLFNSQPVELKTTSIKPKYQIKLSGQSRGGVRLFMDDQSFFHDGSLTSISVYGDTLCKFNDHIPPIFISTTLTLGFSTDIYRINGQVTLVRSNNDTVFRVLPPNHLAPAYVMHWGEYKPDFNNRATGLDFEGSFFLGDWVESPRFIFIRYSEGRDYPRRREQGRVKDYWAIYDKTTKTLTHHFTPFKPVITGNVLMIPPLIENDIDQVGMPFWPHGLNHKEEMFMMFSKYQIDLYIASGNYRNEKLQAISDNMPDDGFCLMIVK